MKKALLTCICLWFCVLVYCQKQQKLDSLQRVFNKQQLDSNQYKAAIDIAAIYLHVKPDSAIKYALVAASISKNTPSRYILSVYNTLGTAYYYKADYQKSIDNFQQYYRFSAILKDSLNMAFAMNNEANVYIELGKYTAALEKHQQALAIRKAVKNELGIAMSYINLGFIYKDIGDYEHALSNFMFALKCYEKLDDEASIAQAYNMIGTIYWRKKDYQASNMYHQKALLLYTKKNNQSGVGISLQSIANNYAEQKDYTNARLYYDKALPIFTAMNDKRQLAFLYQSQGDIAFNENKLTEALRFYTQSLAINQAIKNYRSMPINYLTVAATELGLNNFSHAKQYLDSAEQLIVKSPRRNDKKELYLQKSKYFEATKDYPAALRFKEMFITEKDSLLNADNLKQITDMQVKYETEKKQLEIELLEKDNAIKTLAIQNQKLELNKRLYQLSQKQLEITNSKAIIAANALEIANKDKQLLAQQLATIEKEKNIELLTKQSIIKDLELYNKQLEVTKKNIIITVITVITLLLCLLGFSLYKRYKLRKEKQLQAAVFKQQELATKAILQAEENERKRIAGDLHDGVGQLMSAAKMNLSAMESDIPFANEAQRKVYEKVLKLVDESCQEVRSVSHNMMPNALLKAGLANAIREFLQQIDNRVIKIDFYAEGLHENMDTNIESVLYRVVQECVNNVIKHAQANHLDIALIKDQDGISATIEDNGIGFNTNSTSQYEGIGLKNIKTRVEYLKGTVEWQSHAGKGTLVAIHIPT